MKKLILASFILSLSVLAACSSIGEQSSAASESSSGLVSGESELSSRAEESSSESVESEVSAEESSAAESAPVSSDDPLLILVNSEHPIPDGYEPELETVQGNYQMSALAAPSARELIAAAKDAGYSLMVVSGYRTVETSRRLYNNKVQQLISSGWGEEAAKEEAAKWVAPPGTSEHHTGLAMDIVSSDYFNYYADLEHDFDKFDEFKWLYEHCADYGFILRYPEDKQDVTGITYEPWHYRYVGVENAKAIMSAGLCLEEYVGG